MTRNLLTVLLSGGILIAAAVFSPAWAPPPPACTTTVVDLITGDPVPTMGNFDCTSIGAEEALLGFTGPGPEPVDVDFDGIDDITITYVDDGSGTTDSISWARLGSSSLLPGDRFFVAPKASTVACLFGPYFGDDANGDSFLGVTQKGNLINTSNVTVCSLLLCPSPDSAAAQAVCGVDGLAFQVFGTSGSRLCPCTGATLCDIDPNTAIPDCPDAATLTQTQFEGVSAITSEGNSCQIQLCNFSLSKTSGCTTFTFTTSPPCLP